MKIKSFFSILKLSKKIENRRRRLNKLRTFSDKEVILKESENWNESQEILFRKMLQQGGNFSIGNHKFRIITPIKDNL